MDVIAKLKTAFARQTRALSLRPGFGKGTAVTKAKLRNGVTFDVEDGPWRLVADMNEKWGGANKGPTPGTLGRGAFATCLGIAYKTWAAKLDVDLTELEIEVQADYDTRGFCDFNGIPPYYTEVRFVITVVSRSSEDQVIALLDKAEEHCCYFQIFDRSMNVKREVKILQPEV